MNNSIDNNNNHCRDCCCAKSWEALGVHEYSGKSIPEHIAELKIERDNLLARLEITRADRNEQRRLVIEHDQTKSELFDRITTVSSDRDRLLEACLQAAMAMQSAWYELEPGKSVFGDQFIRQEDMDEKLSLVRAAIDYVTFKGKS